MEMMLKISDHQIGFCVVEPIPHLRVHGTEDRNFSLDVIVPSVTESIILILICIIIRF
jgi:hypothetical protein